MPYIIAGAITFPAMFPWAMWLPRFRLKVFLLMGALALFYVASVETTGNVQWLPLAVPFNALVEELLKYGFWKRWRGFDGAFSFALTENILYVATMWAFMQQHPVLMPAGEFVATSILRFILCTAIHLGSIVWFETFPTYHAIALSTLIHVGYNAFVISGRVSLAVVLGILCLVALYAHKTYHLIPSHR